MFQRPESLRVRVAAALALLVGLIACPTNPKANNTLTGALAFTVVGSVGGSGPLMVSGPGGSGAGVGAKVILADLSLDGACLSGASVTCAPSGQRVEIDVARLDNIPLGTALSISNTVAVLRQNIVGGTACSNTLGTAVSGSVTITILDGTYIAGSFDVTLHAPADSKSSLSGTFDARFCAALVPDGGTNGGSTTGGTTG